MVFQSVVVNVNDAMSTVASPTSLAATATLTVTDAVGSVANRTVNEPVASSTTVRVAGLTTRPASSLSVTPTATDAALPAYSLSVEVAERFTVADSLAVSLSAVPLTVTVWGVFQSVVVNVNDDMSTVASPTSVAATATLTVTDAVGSVANRTVNEPEPSSEIVNDAGFNDQARRVAVVDRHRRRRRLALIVASPTEAAVAVTVTDSSAASASATPDTVTDWAVPQFIVENVNTVDGTDTAPASPDDTVTVTDAVGLASPTSP